MDDRAIFRGPAATAAKLGYKDKKFMPRLTRVKMHSAPTSVERRRHCRPGQRSYCITERGVILLYVLIGSSSSCSCYRRQSRCYSSASTAHSDSISQDANNRPLLSIYCRPTAHLVPQSFDYIPLSKLY